MSDLDDPAELVRPLSAPPQGPQSYGGDSHGGLFSAGLDGDDDDDLFFGNFTDLLDMRTSNQYEQFYAEGDPSTLPKPLETISFELLTNRNGKGPGRPKQTSLRQRLARKGSNLTEEDRVAGAGAPSPGKEGHATGIHRRLAALALSDAESVSSDMATPHEMDGMAQRSMQFDTVSLSVFLNI
ncbi:hypothetical protein KIPB_010719 [Kipferlia bialata]|uniref:Uncharacterized protein n=1 Tax=Kipferlia bialata TaxID=797122 RepID=A0A9K3GLS2_9EUKA|nr:hypothetical protein KIPB_010719 [Kipferlia bialata]|eukprot:g10719.t1